MNFKRDKYVRFEESSSEKAFSSERKYSTDRGLYSSRIKSSVSTAVEIIRRGFEERFSGIKSFKKSPNLHSPSDQPKKDSGKNILDPQGSFLQQWNKIFVFLCVVAVSLDPLFFYIPVIDGANKCISLDDNLQIIACVLRTFVDVFYMLRIIFQFRTGFIAPYSRVFGRGELIQDPRAIAKRYLSSYFIVDILAILPLPQVVVLVIIPYVDGPVSRITKDLMKFVIFIQYAPRLMRIYPLFKEVTRTSGIFTETAWAGAAFNLFLYMLASHVVGAFWYLFSIETEDRCWRLASDVANRSYDNLYCGEHRSDNVSYLKDSCPFLEPNEIKNSTAFNFGIFLDALQSGVLETRDLPKKFFYCFWWGLQNLSSLGQGLNTSTYVWEILFAVFIAILGLVLFSLLIGNMQKYLQSITVRVEEMRVKRRDAEQWMAHRLLPENLRERLRRYEQYRWQETRGVDEESLLRNLPKDLRRDIKRHLCWHLLKSVPMFAIMDGELLDAMCDRLKPVLYTHKSIIVREEDPVDEMLFVMRGNILTSNTNHGKTGFYNAVALKAGDFCGEELLTWALDPNSSTSLPSSTRTVEAITDVEAFALMADDLKFVASQFRKLHSKQLKHTFRLYSEQWRSWGACFIQAAWRRYCKRKQDRSLYEEEDRLQDALANASGTTSLSLGATIYASRFTANALRALRNNQSRTSSPKLPTKLPPLLLQKPAEPDFSSKDH